jgi:hypothetical protein
MHSDRPGSCHDHADTVIVPDASEPDSHVPTVTVPDHVHDHTDTVIPDASEPATPLPGVYPTLGLSHVHLRLRRFIDRLEPLQVGIVGVHRHRDVH